MSGVCYNCFSEKPNDVDVCPNCGYNQQSDEGKYPRALQPGSILNGRYIIGRVLGEGGFGITYIAQDYQTKSRVAIKEYLPEGTAFRETGKLMANTLSEDTHNRFIYGKEQFLTEAETLAGFMGSKNIVNVVKFFEENGTAYLVMEYVDGIGLDSYVKDRGGKLSVREADQLLLPVMDALQWVHSKGIVHRDISPDNILITKDGTAKLIDFGAARYSLGEKSRSLDIILKHGFAPKEQYSRSSKQGPWTDLYAMAATYYYAITGVIPPDSISRIEEDEIKTPSCLGADISPQAENVLMKGLSVEQENRYESISQFESDLEQANRKSYQEPRKPIVKILVAAVLVAVAIAAGIAVLINRSASDNLQITKVPEAEQTTEPTSEPNEGTFEYKLMMADKGDAQMQYEVGMAYLEGTEGVEQDVFKGKKYLNDASNNGIAEASSKLGCICNESYSWGENGYNYFIKAIEQGGTPEAYNGAAQKLFDAHNAKEYGYWNSQNYVEPDDDKMYEYLILASEGNISDADYTLYHLYDINGKEKEGFYYLKKAALAEHYDATVEIVNNRWRNSIWKEYNNEYIPEVSGDELKKLCMENLTEWAESGNSDAMSDLGRHYSYYEENPQLSQLWYKKAFETDMKAAEEGDSSKAFRIAGAYCGGNEYYYGNTVSKDLDEAYKWLDIANSGGASYSLDGYLSD